MKAWLDKNCTDHGAQELSGAAAHWWILNEKLDLDAGHHVSGGHMAALYQDELFDMQSGRAGVARLQAFGVIFGHQRVAIYLEPRNGSGNRVVSNTARTTLLLNDEPLPWAEWAAEFRNALPEPIKRLVEELSATSSGSDHKQSIRERLKQIMDLFKLSAIARQKPERSQWMINSGLVVSPLREKRGKLLQSLEKAAEVVDGEPVCSDNKLWDKMCYGLDDLDRAGK